MGITYPEGDSLIPNLGLDRSRAVVLKKINRINHLFFLSINKRQSDTFLFMLKVWLSNERNIRSFGPPFFYLQIQTCVTIKIFLKKSFYLLKNPKQMEIFHQSFPYTSRQSNWIYLKVLLHSVSQFSLLDFCKWSK